MSAMDKKPLTHVTSRVKKVAALYHPA
ncbi:MAG: hypothetical protein FD130_850, partial [Halothiobacillaceae bacterium]